MRNTTKRTCNILQIFLFVLVSPAFSQTYSVVPNMSLAGINHSVYIAPDGKIGCTTDETTVNEAMLSDPNNIIPTSSALHSSVLSPEQTVSTTSANFVVTYSGFTAQAQAAFQAAVDIWAGLITSTQQIRINANFTPLGGSLLGYAGPNSFVGLTNGSNAWWYADALADALGNTDYHPGASDINATFNSSFNFYYGTDGNCPNSQIDFESVVLHELGHGLGFLGSGRIGSASNNTPCTSDANMACFGYFSGQTYPVIFDSFVKDNANNAVAVNLTNAASYPNPSTTMKSLFTSGSLYFQSSSVRNNNSGLGAQLYAPPSFATGSSYSHLDETTFSAGTLNALMTPTLYYGESEHSAGAMSCGVMHDIGWSVAGACLTVLPVELTTFIAENKITTNLLKWQTATEVNNSFFEIQRSSDAQKFEKMGEVKGVGNSSSLQNYSFTDINPIYGINYYRLRQVDINGKATISNVVSVLNGKAKNNFSVQANVAQSEIFITTSEAKNTDTPFEIIDMLGREVGSSVFKNNSTNIRVSIESLNAGQYLIHFYNDDAPLRFVKL